MHKPISVDFNEKLLNFNGETILTKIHKPNIQEIIDASNDPDKITEEEVVDVVELTAGHAALLALTVSKDTEETSEEDKWLKFSLAEQIRTEEGDRYNTINIGEKKKSLLLNCVSSQWNTLVYGRMRVLLGDSISEDE
jgi:hypothetical protein